MPVTCGSIGDFIAIAQLVKGLVEALNQTRGASAEYQSLIRDLLLLETTLHHLCACSEDQQDSAEVLALYETGRRIEAACSQSIKAFRARIDKYDKTLGGTDTNKIKSTFAKFRWQAGEKAELATFRTVIGGHTASINLLLSAINIAVNKDNRASLTSIQASNEDHWTRQQSSFSRIMNVVNEIAKLVTETKNASISISRSLSLFQQVGCRLLTGLSQIIHINFSTYRAVLAIQDSLLSHSDRVLLGEHFTVEDAIGRAYPVHLQCITSWEAFEFVLTDRFVGIDGYDKVRRREYVLQERITRFDVSRKRIWEGAFSPGQWYDMSMLFNGEPEVDGLCPAVAGDRYSCPGCRTETNGSQESEIQCPACGMWYRRIVEIVDMGLEYSDDNSNFSQTNSHVEVTPSKPYSGPERPPKSSKHKEPKLLDMASFKRVRILLQRLLYTPSASIAPTMADEGDQDDPLGDADSLYSGRTGIRLGSPTHIKEELTLGFARLILDSLPLSQNELSDVKDVICSSLPELLGEFSTSLKDHVEPGVNTRAFVSIRHVRNQIASHARAILSTTRYTSEASRAYDRMNLLWGEGHKIDDCPAADLKIVDLASMSTTEDQSDVFLPEIAEARAYLIERPEYQWLLSRIVNKVRIAHSAAHDKIQ